MYRRVTSGERTCDRTSISPSASGGSAGDPGRSRRTPPNGFANTRFAFAFASLFASSSLALARASFAFAFALASSNAFMRAFSRATSRSRSLSLFASSSAFRFAS